MSYFPIKGKFLKEKEETFVKKSLFGKDLLAEDKSIL